MTQLVPRLSELTAAPIFQHSNMHRDLARLLVLLAVVRVLTVVACPAPAPPRPTLYHREADRLLKRHTTRRRPALPKTNRDLLLNRYQVSDPDQWGNSLPDAGPPLPARPTARVPPEPHGRPRAVRATASGAPPEPHEPKATPAAQPMKKYH